MKMVMAIIDRHEAPRVLEALVSAGYTATFNDSRSGFLRQSKQMLFIGVEAAQLDTVLSIVERNCHSHVESRESVADAEGDARAEADAVLQMVPQRSFAQVGSAVVFVWDIDRFETY